MKIEVYPESANLKILINELFFNSVRISSFLAFSFNFSFGNNPFSESVYVFPVGVNTILFDAFPILICSYSFRQTIEVAGESITADLLLSIFAALFLSLFLIF